MSLEGAVNAELQKVVVAGTVDLQEVLKAELLRAGDVVLKHVVDEELLQIWGRCIEIIGGRGGSESRGN